MHAGSLTRARATSFDGGGSVGLKASLAPLGFGIQTNLLSLGFGGGNSWEGTNPSVSAQRRDSHSIDLSFSFGVDIATSASPWQAGQASDLILGGGLNLHIQRAIVVQATRPTASSPEVCISTSNTNEWLNPTVPTSVIQSLRTMMFAFSPVTKNAMRTKNVVLFPCHKRQ